MSRSRSRSPSPSPSPLALAIRRPSGLAQRHKVAVLTLAFGVRIPVFNHSFGGARHALEHPTATLLA
jgi:hypothetical protein